MRPLIWCNPRVIVQLLCTSDEGGTFRQLSQSGSTHVPLPGNEEDRWMTKYGEGGVVTLGNLAI